MDINELLEKKIDEMYHGGETPLLGLEAEATLRLAETVIGDRKDINEAIKDDFGGNREAVRFTPRGYDYNIETVCDISIAVIDLKQEIDRYIERMEKIFGNLENLY